MRPLTQKSALIQLRASLLKFDDLAEKSEKSSVSNFSTKVSALLAKGARLEALDAQGLTALLVAADNAHADTVACLVSARADVEVRFSLHAKSWSQK